METAFYEKIRAAVLENNLIREGEHVGAAVSGGADSVALSFALAVLARQMPFSLHILHFEHGIRGEDSLRDMEFVQRYAQQLGLPCHIARADVPGEAARSGESIEAAARRMRYDFLYAAMGAHGLSAIAVAHHRGDLAETLLLNLIRGTGLDGLVAMKPRREPGIIRPMLGIAKEEILAFLEERRLPFVYDATNDSPEYSRNFLRAEVAPRLRELNPGAEQAICRAHSLLSADAAALEHYAALEYSRAAGEDGALDAAMLSAMPQAIASRVVRRALDQAGGLVDSTSRNVADILALARSGRTGAHLHMRGIEVSLSYGKLCICPMESGSARPAQWTLLAEPAARPDAFPPADSLVQYVDAEAFRGAALRPRQPGDRFAPFGMEGSKKLKDWLIDRKIPRQERSGMAFAARGGEILWIPGYALSHRARVREDSHDILRVSVQKKEDTHEQNG